MGKELTSVSTVEFPQLLKLIDQSVNFLGVLKDSERKALLETTKSMFQWILIGLDAKKSPSE